MKHGIMIVPEDRWATAKHKWQRAEELGFDHVWTYDHLNWRAFKERDWFTSVPTLTAAAFHTSRVQIGVLVASPNLRHPAQLAKDMSTVADMADDRLIVGLGAGGEGFDASMTRRNPWSRRERADRFVEYVELLDRLLSEHKTSFDGQYYYADSVYNYPMQQPRLPFAIAASGPKGMALTARFAQFWVTMGKPNVFADSNYQDGVETVREQVHQLETACHAQDRDPQQIRRLLVTGPNVGGVLASKEAYFDAVGRYEEVGITDFVVQWPRPDGLYKADEHVLEDVAAGLAPLRAG